MPRLLSLASDIERVRDGRLEKDELPSLLLHGAPGTGKTLVARSLAKTVGLPFIETSIGDWFAGERAHLGTVIGEMRRFFERAISSAPCIALIDELDGLPDRAKLDEREREWWTPVVTRALVMIDRARAVGSSVVLVGTTNHYQFLDPALVRPGRFDIHLEIVGPTTEADFSAILRHHLGLDLAGSDLSVIARTALARQATGAVVEAWVKAARERARSQDRFLEFADLMHVAIHASTRSAAKEMRVAIHEAGHAVVGRVLGGHVQTITLIKTAGADGKVSFVDGDEPATLERLETNIVCGLSGRAADELLNGAAEAGAVADLHRSIGLLAVIHGAFGLRGRLSSHGSVEDAVSAMRFDPKLERKVEADLQRLMHRARQLVALRRRAIESLARTLVANRVATQEDVDAAILADPAGRAAQIWDLIVERVTQDEEEAGADGPTPRQPEADR